MVQSSPEKQRFDVSTTLASAYLQQGSEDEAARSLEEAIAIDRRYSLPAAETSTGRATRAGVYAMHAEFAMSKGHWARAIDDLQTAVGLVANGSQHTMALSIALAANGQTESAQRLMPADSSGRAALRDEIIMRIRDCESHQRQGALEGYLRALNASQPHWEPAVVALVRYLLTQGRGSEAEHLLASELHHGLRRPVHQVHLAAVRASEGRQSESQELLQAIPEEIRTHDPTVIATMQTFRLGVK
jgi:Tfp pilus assembly protein PilF